MAIAEVIKFEGPRDALVWKNSGKEYLISGNEKFNTLSQLIVDEFYEAILFANGNACDLFLPGRYTLETANLPILSSMYPSIVDGEPFPCKVYFVNKVHQLELKWGTQGGITLNDPIYDIFLHVGCCGTMAVRIDDARKFLLKFVGNKEVFSNDDLLHNLRGIISSNVKNYISKIMIQGKVSFFDMNAHIFDIGNLVSRVLSELFMSYGLSIEHFNIETIDVPQEDYAEINKAKSLSSSRKIQGFTWREEQMYKILDDAAKNEGSSGTLMGAGMGLGMGAGMGVGMGQAFGNLTNNAFGGGSQNNMGGNTTGNVFGTNPNMGGNMNMPQEQPHMNTVNGGENLNVNNFFNPNANAGGKFCPQCGNKNPEDAMFCSKCGNKIGGNTCPNCGAQLDDSAMFCSKCGTKVK